MRAHPYPLFDVLLRSADKGMYRPLWSDEILDELAATLDETVPAFAAELSALVR